LEKVFFKYLDQGPAARKIDNPEKDKGESTPTIIQTTGELAGQKSAVAKRK